MSRFGILSLLILSVVNAAIIGPTVYEQDDFGDISLNEFTYSLSVDCDAATLRVIVMNESIKPVEGANVYLKYVDYASPLISSGTTGKDGLVLHELPGNVSLMRGLFILVIGKEGYRGKEVHFDILRCLPNQTTIPSPPVQPPQQLPPPPSENVTKELPPVQNVTEVNATINVTDMADETEQEDVPYSDLCIPAFLILMLILFKRKQLK
jgi:hypothetical protein